jgi:tripartite-type tricarboxylate transporter receptor subunit TctC
MSMRLLKLIAVAAIASSGPALAQTSDFYKGKQITLAVGAPPGGIYDLYGRLFARHLVNFIPGAPTAVVQNMPGAAGMRVANYLYNVAPRDGLTIAISLNSLPLNPFLAPAEVKYRSEKFNWIGRGDAPVHMLFTRSNSGIETIEDAKKREVLTAIIAPGTSTQMYPSLANALIGTRFKLIAGYEGSGGVNMALERGEVEAVGANSYINILVTKPEWIKEKKIRPLFQMTLARSKELPDTPTLAELATTDIDRQAISFLVRTEEAGFYLIAPPETPADRVETLRKAFSGMVESAAFREEAKHLNFGVDPVDGAEMQKRIERVSATPAAVVERFKQAILAQ